MLFSKQDYEYMLNSLTKKFRLYDFIDQNYLINMLDSLMNNGTYEDLTISVDEATKDMNPLFYITFKIQNYLYYKICKLCEDDIEVLLNLVEDKRRVINLIFRKMNVEDDSKLDDYVMNIASLYNGSEAFDSFITRYIMSQIKGVPFTMEKNTSVSVTSDKVEDVPKDKKKKRKKKKEKIGIIVIEKVISSTAPAPVSIASDLVEPNALVGESLSVPFEEPVVLVEEDDKTPIINASVPQVSFYQKCMNKCDSIMGTFKKDSFIEMVLMSDLVNTFSFLQDERFKLYFLMRFGLMNDSFYSKEEIANILECNILDVIGFEKGVIVEIRNYFNRAFNSYENYILSK